MQSSIVKAFIGRHIDLSKIVSISDARFIDRMGSGGYFVGFEIHFQLMDKPIVYERELEYEEEKDIVKLKEENKFGWYSSSFGNKSLAVRNLQGQINVLIEQWKEVRANGL